MKHINDIEDSLTYDYAHAIVFANRNESPVTPYDFNHDITSENAKQALIAYTCEVLRSEGIKFITDEEYNTIKNAATTNKVGESPEHIFFGQMCKVVYDIECNR